VYVELVCTGCLSQLRVPQEHLGKHARCPSCGSVQLVTSANTSNRVDSKGQSEPPAASPVAENANPMWYVRTADGAVYGPAGRDELLQWANEGRVTYETLLRNRDLTDWVPAGEILNNLPSARPAKARSEYRRPPIQPIVHNPPSSQGYRATPNRNRLQAHRGTLILTLGILAWVVSCPIFSIMACSMGHFDLQAMRNGTMDSTGRSFTNAGYILGIVHILLLALAVFGALCVSSSAFR
jgi:GYF domain 2